MTMYFIKITAIATDDNQNFAGEKRTYYYGKNQELIKSHKTTINDICCDNDVLSEVGKYFIKEYAYKRKCDAKRSWLFKNTECSKFWNETAEIIEVDLK